jgi:uncharacterized membrane protein
MNKNRLEAFSDGVIAIIITIMVLEMKVPHGVNLQDLKPLLPVFLSYVLSFIYLGIYWNNHHHLLQTVKQVRGGILWANLNLLFWLSLIPFATGWLGENSFAKIPAGLYGCVLFLAAVSYYILQTLIIRYEGADSTLSKAIGNDLKGKSSLLLYALAIILSCFNSWIACSIYVLVALMWLIPDKRIEKKLNTKEK